MNETAARCPIGTERVDQSAARVNAFIVVVVLVTAIATKMPWLVGYLVADYFIKVAFGFAYSPNCVLAHLVCHVLQLERKPIDSAPKRFAAILAGLMGATALLAFYAADSVLWFNVVAIAFAAVASLDASAEFCLGCHLYGLLPERVSATLVRREAISGER